MTSDTALPVELMRAEALEVADALSEFSDIDEAEGGNVHVIATERRAVDLLRALSATRTAVKPLEWVGGEARSGSGDLYSVQKLSGLVHQMLLNGTAFPGWYSSFEQAQSAAQTDNINRSALSATEGE